MLTRKPELALSYPVAIESCLGRDPENAMSDDLKLFDHHCLKRIKKRQKPADAYQDPWNHERKNDRVPKVLPSMPMPILAVMPPKTRPKPPKKLKHRHKRLRAIIKFASSSLSGKMEKEPKKKKRPSPRDLTQVKSGSSTPVRAHAVVRRPIEANAQRILRQSFNTLATEGALKRPVIHVEFHSPRNLSECASCISKDFLFVFVGLCNVFILQFVIVVLLFFTDKEVNLSELATYYYDTNRN